MKFAEPHGVAHLATTFRFYELLSVIYLQVPLRRPPLPTPSHTLAYTSKQIGCQKVRTFQKI